MTRNEILRIWPNASEATIKANLSTSAMAAALRRPAVKAPVTVQPCSHRAVSIKTPHNQSLSVSTDENRLNKLEAAFLAHLRSLPTVYKTIHIQAVTLKIGDDCRYSVDFATIANGGEITGWEVKGFMREDALIKLKVAARMFPWIRFVLVTRKNKQWIQKEINP